ncbi:MAG TPA: transposase [Candidatus Dormibacteraeota bacterium]|nr:transposase [Candidatus Dormibacteraeota bacterium]
MNKRVAPSVELEAAIEGLLTGGLAEGLTDAERLAEIGRLGARLAIQRGVEEEVDAFLGRMRYERTPEARGWRNGNRPRQVQTAEGELEIQVPQIRGAAEKFVSSVIPNGQTALRTRPLEALIIGGWVRGLADRDIESLVEDAGLGQLSKTAVCEITKELRARYQAFQARGLGEVELLVLFCDAIYLPTMPSGAKEGVLVAWGNDETGQRVLLDVVLGQRERLEDWLEMGRGLVRRGLRAPMLVVTDGAPGLIRAIEELGPDSDRQRCTVHVLRNLVAKLPKQDAELRQQVEAAYWTALDEATSPADGEARLRQLVADLEARTRARPPAWPTTCRLSVCTSPTLCAFASGSARTSLADAGATAHHGSVLARFDAPPPSRVLRDLPVDEWAARSRDRCPVCQAGSDVPGERHCGSAVRKETP